MCILLCFMEYNEKSRPGTTDPDELFKNAVAAIYKAAAVLPLFFLSFCIHHFFIIINFFSFLLCVREYRCRVESTSDGKENFFSFT